MWKNLLTLLVSTALCAAVFWWAAPRLAPAPDPALPDYDQLTAYDPARPGGHLLPDRNLLARGARVGEPVRWVTNSVGFRNAREFASRTPEGTLRILFYGDSFVDGMRTGQDDTIGAVLESVLSAALARPVQVILSGHNNPANAWYHWQTHGRHMRPQVVLIGLTVGNDLVSHNFGAGVLPVAESLDRLVALDPSVHHAGVGSHTAMIPPDGFVPESERSPMDALEVAVAGALARRFPAFADLAPPAMGPEPGVPGRARAAGFFTSLGLYYTGRIAFIERAWLDFETLLPGFVAQVRHAGARPVLVAFPTRIEALPRDWRRLVGALQLDPARFDTGAVARRLDTLCADLALACVDTREALREGQREEEVFRPLGDMHLSEHGQAVTALALARFFGRFDFDAPPAPVPAGWLDGYRERIDAWRREVFALSAPWMDPATGQGALRLPEDREALREVLVAGWAGGADAGAFLGGDGLAIVHLPTPLPGRAWRITLEARAFGPGPARQRLRVTDGERVFAERELDGPEFTPMRFEVPAAVAGKAWTTIALEFPDASAAADDDTPGGLRRGVAVRALAIEPADAAPGEDERNESPAGT